MKHNPGIGATPDLSLRVSVATLARVVFKHPLTGELMLALERKATLHENKIEVKSQPFGGAIRILDVDAIHDLIGDFHFDSKRSRTGGENHRGNMVLVVSSPYDHCHCSCPSKHCVYQILGES